MNADRHGSAPLRLGRLHVEVLESLNQHRLLSTVQIHALHAPETTRRFVQQFLLGRLHTTGLVAAARGRRGLKVWHLTERGVDAVEAMSSRAETRHKVISATQAAGPLQQHTLGVSDVGIAFVRAARERGDDCGPFDWRHEIAHSLGPAPGRRLPEQLIADAVLTYQLTEPDDSTSVIYRFVELDRATRSAATLAAGVGRYARLYRRMIPADDPADPPVPLWTRLYPAFPPVLVALTGRRRDLLETRRETVLELCRQDPDLQEVPEVEVSICLLDDLTRRGPFAPIFRTVANPDDPVDWLDQREP
ncbi:MAG: replication-relaxation family protein [Thermoleophilaceae bacterium]